MEILDRRARVVVERLRSLDGLLVALSGGVDSAVLLALAVEALGRERVVAVTGRSPSLAAADLEDAREAARGLGVAHEVLDTDELAREGYRANDGDRCFHCRTELFEALARVARRLGIPAVAYGAIKEDADDHRPGMRAAEAHGVIAPLLDAGIGKSEVRELATRAGLRVRDKPAGACLASRIPVGTRVTPERLGQVERCEEGLRRLGFSQLRVRHHGEVARLELDEPGIARLADPELRREAVRWVRAAGFRFVTLDLEGYRTGSLNPSVQRTGPARESGQ